MLKDDFWDYFNKKGVSKEDVKKLLKQSDQVVDYERSVLKNGRYWQISKDEVRSLYSVIKEKEPKIVVETGMGSGVSTTSILSAMGPKGKLISIDPGIPYGKGDKEVGFIIPANLRSNLTYVKGTSSEKLKDTLSSIKKLDVFFHDSDHSYENVMFELNSVWSKMEKDPLIIVDNFDWSEAASDFAKEKGMKLRNLADDLALISK
ncbi:MAG: class I SAM-dependent methyltransferase [Candidatus Thermoplasmatota archaeon]|nr:class I SAM-dependent methyltransferase [Candidatus Thermoplasmatota archaeon]